MTDPTPDLDTLDRALGPDVLDLLRRYDALRDNPSAEDQPVLTFLAQRLASALAIRHRDVSRCSAS